MAALEPRGRSVEGHVHRSGRSRAPSWANGGTPAHRIRLIARAGTDLHCWDVRVVAVGDDGPPRLAFGSRIGDRDRNQRIEIPP